MTMDMAQEWISDPLVLQQRKTPMKAITPPAGVLDKRTETPKEKKPGSSSSGSIIQTPSLKPPPPSTDLSDLSRSSTTDLFEETAVVLPAEERAASSRPKSRVQFEDT